MTCGAGIEVGSGIGDWSNDGVHDGLLLMSFPKSVISSIMTHYSAGLLVPPNVKRRYMSAHIAVLQIHLIADQVLRCRRQYAASKLYLQMRIAVLGYTYCIACIMCMKRMNM